MKFKVGDRVRITRTAKDHERGWQNSWVSPMNRTVGRVGIITDISPVLRHDILVKVRGICMDWGYPAFVLKLEPKKKKKAKK